MEAIPDRNYNILDKDFKDMCVFASDLNLIVKNRHRNNNGNRHHSNSKRGFNDNTNSLKRRRFDNNNNSFSNKPSKYGGPTGPIENGRGEYCGETYMKGHVCRQWRQEKNSNSNNSNSQRFSRAATRDNDSTTDDNLARVFKGKARMDVHDSEESDCDDPHPIFE
ncbi:unnamed protein product [Absidia cylindrospora]